MKIPVSITWPIFNACSREETDILTHLSLCVHVRSKESVAQIPHRADA